jgi:hypothetical protein
MAASTLYYYYRGAFLKTINVFDALKDIVANIVLVDSIILKSIIEVKSLCAALNKKFDFANALEPKPVIILSDVDEKELKEAGYSFSSIFVNSSIWIYYLNINNGKEERIQDIIHSVKRSAELKLYNNINAREYIDFHLRVQSQNFLTGSGHAQDVTPIIYSDELQRREELNTLPDFDFFFDESKLSGDLKNKRITLRILLVDDKINFKNGEDTNCKAKIIKELLELKFDYEKQKNVCWRTYESNSDHAIEIFQMGCGSGCPGCIKRQFKQTKDFFDQIRNNYDKTQIIAVKNIKTARKLLVCNEFRFDLIMMDYLLDKKKDKNGKELEEREYATEFWGDGTFKYFEFTKEEIEKKFNEKQRNKYLNLRETYTIIKSNRGPMNRLWIFPITAFNQTFIDDLRNRGIRLNDYYWYLSRGADPINTPFMFIYTLNKFLQLMLSEAIFSLFDLSIFLKKSIEKWKKLKEKDIEKWKKLNESEKSEKVRILMTTEYIYFINQYAMHEQIERDLDAGSLFAHYINENFFEKEKHALIKISDSIRRFYHSLAYGEDGDYLKAQERLFRMLDLFKSKIQNDSKELLKELKKQPNENNQQPDENQKAIIEELVKRFDKNQQNNQEVEINLIKWEDNFNMIIQQRFNSN